LPVIENLNQPMAMAERNKKVSKVVVRIFFIKRYAEMQNAFDSINDV
jgi:hypothetical protein